METKLKKLQFAEGEELIYEEDKINILAETKPRATKYINSMITVTNFRIILAQKMVFGGYQIRYVIDYSDRGPEFSIKGMYVSCKTTKEDIQFIDDGKPVMKIKTSGGSLVGIINVFIKDPESVITMIK